MSDLKTASYGISGIESGSDEKFFEESFRRNGYFVIPDAIDAGCLEEARKRLDAVYKTQLQEFGEEPLRSISELKLARAPFLYDSFFRQFYLNAKVVSSVRLILGDYIVLHLQNGILNPPDETHHQSKWHRDLPYQEWTSSKPLAIGALFCIDDFSEVSGGTVVLPNSHQFDSFPTLEYVEANSKTVEAPAGSVILFDAMLYHRAGENRSSNIRRGLNHVFTMPLLKQQIDFPSALGDSFDGGLEERKLLGYDCRVPGSVLNWRKERLKKQSPK